MYIVHYYCSVLFGEDMVIGRQTCIPFVRRKSRVQHHRRALDQADSMIPPTSSFACGFTGPQHATWSSFMSSRRSCTSHFELRSTRRSSVRPFVDHFAFGDGTARLYRQHFV